MYVFVFSSFLISVLIVFLKVPNRDTFPSLYSHDAFSHFLSIICLYWTKAILCCNQLSVLYSESLYAANMYR